MRRRSRWQTCPVRFALVAALAAGLTVGARAFCPICRTAPKEAGVAGLVRPLADRNGWTVRPDPVRPHGVAFLVDPRRRDPSPSLSFLRTAAAEWDGIVRVEAVVTTAGAVDAVGGLVWRGLWFYGDPRMLDGLAPELP